MPKESLVILTGAGISAESGLRTFRDSGGLWEGHRPEDVASIEAYRRDPEMVQRFYNARRAQLQDPAIQPNDAHRALVKLEQEWKGEFLIITQNVDNLHERAGSRKLLHMHGELLKVRCDDSGKVFEWKEPILEDTRCPDCGRTACLRPHIVWFGEMPLEMERCFRVLRDCTIFASIGTSGNVYPAAGFVREVPKNALTIEFNREESLISSAFKEHRIGPATQTVTDWVEELLNARVF